MIIGFIITKSCFTAATRKCQFTFIRRLKLFLKKTSMVRRSNKNFWCLSRFSNNIGFTVNTIKTLVSCLFIRSSKMIFRCNMSFYKKCNFITDITKGCFIIPSTCLFKTAKSIVPSSHFRSVFFQSSLIYAFFIIFQKVNT